MNEFTLDGRHFFAYVRSDMNGDGNGCQINVCELGEGDMLETMTKYWQLPADSLGKVNDSGLRVHCIAVEKGVDEDGNEEVTLLTFKAFNGMGVYKIGKGVEPGGPIAVPGDVNGDGEVTGSDVTALYNHILFGQDTEVFNGDQNGDGEVTGSDVTAVYNIILGL